MELFLNLCWLALVLPAYVLWRRRVSSKPCTRASFVIVCTLGCALVLLFPVISASDDLHAVAQAMEESENGFRHDGHGPCAHHSVHHAALPLLLATVSREVVFEQVGMVLSPLSRSLGTVFVDAYAGRAPPLSRPVSV